MVILKKSTNQCIGLFGVGGDVSSIHIEGNSYVIADFAESAIQGSPYKAAVGAIIGYANQINNSSCAISSCSSNADIYSKGSIATGGFIGINGTDKLDNMNNYSTGCVYAMNGIMTGGLIGGTSSISVPSYMGFSYATGNIYTKNVTNVGGVYGYGGHLRDCYYSGNINASGGSYVGGLSGIIYGGAENSYASGMINGSGGNYVGGLAGKIDFNSKPLTSCYYNGETSKVSNVYGSANAEYSSTGISLTTMEMTGQGEGRASEKMKGIADSSLWTFSVNGAPGIRGLPNEAPLNNEVFIDPSEPLPEPTLIDSKSYDIKGCKLLNYIIMK